MCCDGRSEEDRYLSTELREMMLFRDCSPKTSRQDRHRASYQKTYLANSKFTKTSII